MAYPFGSAFLQQGNQVGLWLVRWGKPRHNGAFFEHIPEGCLQSLCELREGVIGGDRGFLETAYPVENFFVRERLFVLERDAEGGRSVSQGNLRSLPARWLSASGEHRVQRAGADLFLELFLEKRTLWSTPTAPACSGMPRPYRVCSTLMNGKSVSTPKKAPIAAISSSSNSRCSETSLRMICGSARKTARMSNMGAGFHSEPGCGWSRRQHVGHLAAFWVC